MLRRHYSMFQCFKIAIKHAVQTEKNKNAEAGNSFELTISGDDT